MNARELKINILQALLDFTLKTVDLCAIAVQCYLFLLRILKNFVHFRKEPYLCRFVAMSFLVGCYSLEYSVYTGLVLSHNGQTPVG